MSKESPTKVMARTSTILNPYLTGELTVWPMPEWYHKDRTEALQGTPTEVLKVKPQNENDDGKQASFPLTTGDYK
jgi:hypothetical protein